MLDYSLINMKILILSDIHANWYALTSKLISMLVVGGIVN